MQIVRSLEPGLTTRPAVLTMGKYDGLHVGHQRLIRTAVERATTLDLLSVVLTWEPHPNAVLRPDQPLELITVLEEKIAQIAAIGPDLLIIAPFTATTKATSAEAYLREITAAVPVRELWVGEGFAMGRGRSGDVPSLMVYGRELGFAVGTVSEVRADGSAVSASVVRELLRIGDLAAASTLLGRPFALRGLVVKGDQRGRTIGFPTANLQPDPLQLLPADGVYACRAFLPGSDIGLPAVTNVGVRPTFDGLRRTVEAHLLDWSGDLYDQVVRLTFEQRIRGEQKFSGIDALVAQIQRDAATARACFAAER